MNRLVVICICLGLLGTANASELHAQGGGGFGGGGGAFGSGDSNDRGFRGVWRPEKRLEDLHTEEALSVIKVDGTAEIRVKAEEIRVVLAITSEAETANESQEKNAAVVKAVRQDWKALEIADDSIVEDFINILPRYEWRLAERDGRQVRIQQRNGYRMQSNLHVAVKTEPEAMAAIKAAFKHGVSEIVTFDYWSSKLNEEKQRARQAAVQAAKSKAETLLAVFTTMPQVVNIQENTAAFFPNSLYATYENVLEEKVEYSRSERDVPRIRAYRPKMTFFHGLQSQADVRPSRPAMRPEIAVVSTVRIYYQSPGKPTVKKGNKGNEDPFQ